MDTGHSTQLIWKSSKYLGMGMATANNAYYCTAQYSPPGNMQGQYRENVLKYRENVLNNSPPSSFEPKSVMWSLILFVLFLK